jgi:signal transduction histidine kinase
MGMGMAGARRLMDRFDARTGPDGTTVELGKRFPRGVAPVDGAARARVAAELARQRPPDVVEELQRQNQELLSALAELRGRQDELFRLNRELEDTNRGVVALYAELDERLEELRRANALRSQFMSYMSHEFRTPLDSVLALSGLLLDRVDGELTSEQEKQVGFIRRSARDLLNMVDDLLDTARVDAGKVAVHPTPFAVADLFHVLRATLRPLLTGDETQLVFEDPGASPPLFTDEAKVAQILRNFISNALKFTEDGRVGVYARTVGLDMMSFSVSDSGIGIAPEDQARIFEDFNQVDGELQRTRRGTGLGLPLSRKLATLLGGEISVRSVPGEGSTFTLTIPREYHPPEGADADEATDDR